MINNSIQIMCIGLIVVGLSACSKETVERTATMMGALTGESLGAPFDEIHILFCKSEKGKLSQTETIRYGELTMEHSKMAIDKMKETDTEAMLKNQEFIIKTAKAMNNETCR